VALQQLDHARALTRARHRQADEHPCLLGIGIAIVEFGDVARTQQAAEGLEAARRLGNGHREHGFALFTQFGALGDVAQAVEVHVCARGHRDQRLALQLVAGNRGLHPGNRQGAGRFQNRTGVLEHILDRRADGIVVDADDFIDVQLRQPEGFLADFFHRHAVGKNAHARQRDARALA